MPLYLLDTNILIDLSDARSSRKFFESVLSDPTTRLGTSILCVAEFIAGAGSREERFLKGLIEGGELTVFPLDAVEDAMRAGTFRKKHFFGLPDALILATALRQSAHLLTHDTEFLKKAKSFVPASDPVPESPK